MTHAGKCIPRMKFDETVKSDYIEHCLEFIRQSAMCHGDITITAFRWLHDASGRIVEPTTKEGALHQCVKWNRLSDWAKSRRVDLYDRNLLVQKE